MEAGSRDGVYSIGAVAKMLGIPAQTLRSWEDRYGEVVPERSAGGQRLYSRDEVDQPRFLSSMRSSAGRSLAMHTACSNNENFPRPDRGGADETSMPSILGLAE